MSFPLFLCERRFGKEEPGTDEMTVIGRWQGRDMWGKKSEELESMELIKVQLESKPYTIALSNGMFQ